MFTGTSTAVVVIGTRKTTCSCSLTPSGEDSSMTLPANHAGLEERQERPPTLPDHGHDEAPAALNDNATA